MVNYTAVVLTTLVVLALLFVVAEGYLINPRTMAVKLSRKKAHPSHADIQKVIPVSSPPLINWSVTRPNITINTMVLGGLGNTLMAYSIGCEASRRFGLRPPTLVIEPEGEFDFHNIGAAKFGFKPTSVSEILPWASVAIMNSSLNVITTLNGKSLWMGNDYDKLVLKRNVIQVTNYEVAAPVSDETFVFIRDSINREIYDYIQTHYGDLSDCMAIHLRMGQPTDWFAPPRPYPEDIMTHFQKHNPRRVLVFTDNKPLAEEVIAECQLPNILWVGESGPIELFMIGMCSSAVISHSTFSVMGCRIFGNKNVSITVAASEVHFEKIFHDSWSVTKKEIKYRNGKE